jgi:predicted nucleic acid-binding protein
MIFVDTWAWVALASEEDQYHAAAQKAHRRLKKKRPRYVTTDYVLCEVITHLYRKQAPTEAQAFVNGLLKALSRASIG